MSVRDLSGRARTAEHRVTTTHSHIEFGWPRDHGVSFRLESTFGRVESWLPGELDDTGSRRVLRGEVGGRGGLIELAATSGSVRLIRD